MGVDVTRGMVFQCRYPGGPGCENATPDGPCCGQLVPAPLDSPLDEREDAPPPENVRQALSLYDTYFGDCGV